MDNNQHKPAVIRHSKSITKIHDQISELTKIKNEIEKNIEFYKLFSLQMNYNISKSILEKVIHIAQNLNEDSLLEIYANVRFLLETLINLRLFNKEDKYIYIFYFSRMIHQREKTKKFIRKINDEIQILNKFQECEEKKSLGNLRDIERLQKRLDEEEQTKDALDKEFKKIMTIFTKNLEQNGYAFQADLLKKELLPKYEDAIAKILKEIDENAKKVLNDKIANSIFDFKRQKSKVFSEFKDNRSWKEKAKATNLSKDYDFIYDISSSLIHSTSYSIFTSPESNHSDIDLCTKIIEVYLNNIIDEVKELTNYDKLNRKLIILNLESI